MPSNIEKLLKMSETDGVCPLADEGLIKKAREEYKCLKDLQVKEYNELLVDIVDALENGNMYLDDLYPLIDRLVKHGVRYEKTRTCE